MENGHYVNSVLRSDRARYIDLSCFTGNTGARLTKYLSTILRYCYDNAKVTIDLRLTSNLRNILRRTQGFS